jgi:hypothetical protein
MKLRSNFVLKRTVSWRTVLLGLHVWRYEPQDTGPKWDTAVIIKGAGDGEQFQYGDHASIIP